MTEVKRIDLGAVSAYALAVENGYTGTEEEFVEILTNALNYATQAQESASAAAGSAEEAGRYKTQAGEILASVNLAGTQQIEAIESAGTQQTNAAKEAIEAKGKETLDSIPDSYEALQGDVTQLRGDLEQSKNISFFELFSYTASNPSLVYGTLDPLTGKDLSNGNTLYIRTTFIQVTKGTMITVSDGYQQIVSLYNTRASSDFNKSYGYTKKTVIIDNDCWIRVAIKKDDGTTFDELSIDSIVSILIATSNIEKINHAISLTSVYVTPEQFGAIGDGVTDDTEAIQAMIDSSNGLYCVLSKKYLISAPLKLYNKIGIKIVGTGANSHACRLIASKSIDIFQVDGCTQITFSNIRFEYINDGNTNSANGIHLGVFDETINKHRVNSFRAEKCYFRGLYNGIIIDAGTGYTYIQDCTFQNIVYSGSLIGTGIKIGNNYDSNYYSINPNYIYIYRNQFLNSADYPFRAIQIFGGYWVEINKNDFANFNTGEYAIRITNKTTRACEMHIEDNYVSNTNTLLFVYTSEDKEIANYIIKNNKFLCSNGDQPMIRITGALTEIKRRIRNVVISDNNFSNTSDDNSLVYIAMKYVDGYHFSNNTSYQLRKLINNESVDRCALNDCIKGY